MKATKRLITFTAVLALLLSMASCSLLGGKANLTQKITAGNIEVTIRDDMKEDPTITSKGDSYITCYFWSGYGLNIGAVGSSEVKFSGQDPGALLMETLKDQKNLSELKKFGDICYAEYTLTDSGKEYLFTDFILEEGYEFYFLEFYTMSKSSSGYMKQYQDIVSSVKMLEEPEKTKEITIEGVKLTVDGDAADQGGNVYLCGRYMVSAYAYNIPAGSMTSKQFCESVIKQGNYQTADGQSVTEINTSDEGISSFECYMNNLNAMHYAKVDGKKLIYIFFFTSSPADDALKAEFAAIASAASLA